MTVIQVLLAVCLIAAVCGTGYNRRPKCYRKGGYCENKKCRTGFKCAKRYTYGCPSGTKCCLRDNFYNQHQGHRGKRGNGYCTNGGCREGYNYYDNRGYCKYGSRSYKYDCNSYTGCCLPRNPYSKLHYYCTSHNGCPKDYYFYNNKGYYYYNKKHYYNCQLYNGCCIRGDKRSNHH
ncbi:uncharacterized protein [Mytilus edulis]|uniref:uncharacterized protein n=1 Tax=Mytilus edulis TaxID=6550 RepID=UPI0039F05067